MSGVQVAIIAPTTLLARQHYQSFAERFRGFPINVRPYHALLARVMPRLRVTGSLMVRQISWLAHMR